MGKKWKKKKKRIEKNVKKKEKEGFLHFGVKMEKFPI